MPTFLSYSSVDDEIADRITTLFRELNVDYFVDRREIVAGDWIHDRIANAIMACDEVLIVATANSLRSSWVPYEVGYADGSGKRVLVLLCERLSLPGFMTSRRHFNDLEDLGDYYRNNLGRPRVLFAGNIDRFRQASLFYLGSCLSARAVVEVVRRRKMCSRSALSEIDEVVRRVARSIGFAPFWGRLTLGGFNLRLQAEPLPLRSAAKIGMTVPKVLPDLLSLAEKPMDRPGYEAISAAEALLAHAALPQDALFPLKVHCAELIHGFERDDRQELELIESIFPGYFSAIEKIRTSIEGLRD